jgi:hypothetical protein
MLVGSGRYVLAELLCRHALPASIHHEATLGLLQDLRVALSFQERDSEAEDFFQQVLSAYGASESEAVLWAVEWLSRTLSIPVQEQGNSRSPSESPGRA